MKKYYYSVLFAPWQETFADAGDEDEGENIWVHFYNSRFSLGSCWIHFSTILGPPMLKKYVFNQKSISLKLHILTSSPLFDREHISP